MRAPTVSLIIALTVASAHAGIPSPSPEQMRHYARELDYLEKSFQADQRKGQQFGEHFWHESKLFASRNSPEIIAAIMQRARAWTDEEGLLFVPLVSLLPRPAALKILRSYQRSSRDWERTWANDYIIEFDTDDTKEAAQRHSHE